MLSKESFRMKVNLDANNPNILFRHDFFLLKGHLKRHIVK